MASFDADASAAAFNRDVTGTGRDDADGQADLPAIKRADEDIAAVAVGTEEIALPEIRRRLDHVLRRRADGND